MKCKRRKIEKKMFRKSFKYRAYPNKGTAKRSFKMMVKMAEVWNISLNERNKTYENSKINPDIKPINSYKSQYHLIKKKDHPEYKKYNAQSLQDVQVKLDSSWKSFFTLYKIDKTARPPREKGIHKCLVFRQSGWRLEGNKLIIPTLGKFKIKMHRPIEGDIKTVSVTLDKNLWFINFSCEICEMPVKKRTGKSIKIILPDEYFLEDSEGNIVPALNYYKRTEPQIKRLCRIKDRRKKGGRRRKMAVRTLAKCHRHIKYRRDYELWAIALYYAKNYKRIVLYTRPFKLAMQYAVNREEAKLTADNARGRFIDMLEHKCNEWGTILTIVKDEKLWQTEIKKRTAVAKGLKLLKIIRRAKRAVKYNCRGLLPYLEKDCEKLTTLRI